MMRNVRNSYGYKRILFSLLFIGLMFILVTGCSKEAKTSDPGSTSPPTPTPIPQNTVQENTNQVETVKVPEVTKDPIKLSVYYPFSDGSYDSFMTGTGGIIQKKYPNFSFEWRNTKDIPLNALAASGTDVDIFHSNANTAAQFDEAGFVMDITELIKKYNFDLSKVESVALDIIRNASGGKLTALPVYLNHHLMFYNRDIFDKFAVDYPRNHMTWDEVYDLARNMTRTDGDVQYIGFSHQFLNGTFALLNSYGQELIDPKTNEVTYENGVWARMYQNFRRFYEIPGHEYLTGNQNVDAFAKDQRLAMLVTLSNRASGNPNNVPENWDVVSQPEFPDAPGVGSGIEPIYLYLSSTSKHKDEAFVAIATMLSEEAQVQQALSGRHPAVNIPDIEKILSNEAPSLKGRNVAALFANKFAPALTLSQDTIAIRPHLGPAVNEIMKGEKDINTALREAAEKAKQTMAERAAAK